MEISVDKTLLVEVVKMSERLCELSNSSKKGFGFEANSLTEYLHHATLQLLQVYSAEDATELGLKIYLSKDKSGRVYV